MPRKPIAKPTRPPAAEKPAIPLATKAAASTSASIPSAHGSGWAMIEGF